MTIPEPPEPDDVIDYDAGAGPESMFDADSMRRHGEACYRAATEAAAQKLDKLAREAWDRGAARECDGFEVIAADIRAGAAKGLAC